MYGERESSTDGGYVRQFMRSVINEALGYLTTLLPRIKDS